MDRLWAPWRKAYIRPDGPKKKGCLFCRMLNEKKDVRNYVLKRTRSSFAVLNIYPYNNGHLMVVPNRHTAELEKLSDSERLDLLALCDDMTRVLKKEFRPHGLNVGMNLGRPAGAGVPGHLHMHIVPRWSGDSNFMTTISGTRVVSESLDSAYRTLLRGLTPGKSKSKGARNSN